MKPCLQRALRRQLLANGYEPHPAYGKAIHVDRWNKGEITEARLAETEAAYPDHTNTSLRTGPTVGFDIDLKNAAHAIEIEKVAVAHLGDTPLRRVGSKGALLCYRNENPIAKITVGTKENRLVEILGAGQHFFAYGVHPGTGKEYEWTNEYLGGEPAVTPLNDLPEVTPEQLRAVAEAIAAKLISLGYGAVTVSGNKAERNKPVMLIAAGEPFTPAELTRMLSFLDPGCSRDEWRDIAAGLHAAPCTDDTFDKRDLFVRWSRGEVGQ